MPSKHILSFGAGVQSTTLLLLAQDGAFPCDLAIFADTGEEPASVYAHLWWCAATSRIPVHVTSAGVLGDAIITGMRKPECKGFAVIPAFVETATGARLGRRQCTREYKVDPLQRYIRRIVCGCAPGRPIPRGVEVHEYVGISRDEARRAVNVKKRIESRRGWFAHFPLLDRGWTRADCLRFLAERVPHPVPKSSCVFCPFKSEASWQIVQNDPVAWARAIEIDRAIRVKPGWRGRQFLHRSLQPLGAIDFDPRQHSFEFVAECEGMCGV